MSDRDGSQIRVSPATRDRVLSAAKELGYSLNLAARSLAGGPTGLVGVFTFEPIFPSSNNDFYQPFLMGIEEEAEQHGLDLLLFTSVSGGARRHIYSNDGNRMSLVDGSILLGRHDNKSELARLSREGFPFVFIGRRTVRNLAINYVAPDNAGGTAEVVARLRAVGHERIAFAGLKRPSEPGQDREKGYRGSSLVEKHVERLAPNELTQRWVEDLLRDGVTALLIEESPLASAFLRAIHLAGISVPGDLSVALLGDPQPSSGFNPLEVQWTGYRLPREELGRQSVRLLAGILSGQQAQPTSVLLPCHFVEGSTMARPSHRHPRRGPKMARQPVALAHRT